MVRRVHAIQRAAYAVEAELIGTRAIPPLHETLEELAAAGKREEFFGVFEEAASEGAAGWDRSVGRGRAHWGGAAIARAAVLFSSASSAAAGSSA